MRVMSGRWLFLFNPTDEAITCAPPLVGISLFALEIDSDVQLKSSFVSPEAARRDSIGPIVIDPKQLVETDLALTTLADLCVVYFPHFHRLDSGVDPSDGVHVIFIKGMERMQLNPLARIPREGDQPFG